MACNQTLSGIARDCAANMGGIVEAYCANRDDISTMTVSDNKISAITMVSQAKFRKYVPNRNTGSLTSTWNINAENGTHYVTSEVILPFSRMETSKRVEINAMAQNDMVTIVKDANGKFWLLGYDEPVTASAGGGETGTVRGDRNGYSITLQDNSKELPYEVDGSIIDNLVA